MSRSPQDALTQARERIDQTLWAWLDEVSKRLSQEHPEGAGALELLQMHLRSGGKRLRPLFCYFGHLVCRGDDDERILRAAGSLELLHAFAIIHDDVMDEASTRRGVPSLQIRAEYGLAETDKAARGRALAILAGDLALVLSDDLLLHSGFSPESLSAAMVHLSEMRLTAVAGQYLDLTAPERLPHGALDIDEAQRIARMKTAAYTTIKPLAIGASLADPNRVELAALEAYGTALGEAFQITDDLAALPDERDMQMGRPTWPIAWAITQADPAIREAVSRVWGKSAASEQELEEARSALSSDEVRQACSRRVTELVLQAKEAIGITVPEGPPEEAVGVLNHLAEAITSYL